MVDPGQLSHALEQGGEVSASVQLKTMQIHCCEQGALKLTLPGGRNPMYPHIDRQ